MRLARWALCRLLSAPHAGVRARSSSSMSDGMEQRLVWVDLEMTGLDIKKDQIIEMACLITDADLNMLAEGPNLIIKQPDELLDTMSTWCKEHHGKSGLTQAVRDSKISLAHAEYEFLSFIRKHTPPGCCPLAGNSVHVDKVFLNKYMPQFMRHLHYRIVDVSTVKELCRRWYPVEYECAPKKASSHRYWENEGHRILCFYVSAHNRNLWSLEGLKIRALDDIEESIKELRFYRQNVFKKVTDEKLD